MKLEDIPGIQPDEVVLIRKIAVIFKAQKITICEPWRNKVRVGDIERHQEVVTLAITEEQKTWAKEKALRLGKLRNSIREGEGNYDGYIGEKVACDFLVGKVGEADSYDWDFILPSGKTVDVKTKRSKVIRANNYSMDHFEQSVCAKNISQNCDYYVFAVTDDISCFLLGYCSKERFYKEAVFHKKGEVDNRWNKNFVFTEDCYNIKVPQLDDMRKLK